MILILIFFRDKSKLKNLNSSIDNVSTHLSSINKKKKAVSIPRDICLKSMLTFLKRNNLILGFYDHIDSGNFSAFEKYYRKEHRESRKEGFQTQVLIRLLKKKKQDLAKEFLGTLKTPSVKMNSIYIYYLTRNGFGNEAYEVLRNMTVENKYPSRPAYFEIVKYLYNSFETTKGWIVLTEMKKLYPLNKPILEFCYDKMLDKTQNVTFDYSSLNYSTNHMIKRLRNVYSRKELAKVERDIHCHFQGDVNQELSREWVKAILKFRGTGDAFLFASYFDGHYNLSFSAFSSLAIECSLLGRIDAAFNASSYVVEKYDPLNNLEMHAALLKVVDSEERLHSYWNQLPGRCKKNRRLIDCFEEASRRLEGTLEASMV